VWPGFRHPVACVAAVLRIIMGATKGECRFACTRC
jgi:hypothetical protein